MLSIVLKVMSALIQEGLTTLFVEFLIEQTRQVSLEKGG